MTYEFDCEITQLEGKIKWSVFFFPYSAQECFASKGNIPVCITVDGHPFDHMLLPSKKGHYLVYNEFIRRAVGKTLGDHLHVTLEKDERKREITLAKDIAAALDAAGCREAFDAQPDYFKREQLNHIELAKKPETRSNRIDAMIKRLG